MDRPSLLKDSIGCCFGSSPHDTNEEGNKKDNNDGNKGASTSKDANKDTNGNMSQRDSNNTVNHHSDDKMTDDRNVGVIKGNNTKIDENTKTNNGNNGNNGNNENSDNNQDTKDEDTVEASKISDLDVVNRDVDTSNVDYTHVTSTDGKRDDNDDDNGNSIDNNDEDPEADDNKSANAKDHDNNDSTSDNDNDGKAEGRDTHLCETCHKIDFTSLFTSHFCRGRPVWGADSPCGCLTEKTQKHGLGGLSLPRTLEDAAAACCFCKFLHECQVRLSHFKADENDWISVNSSSMGSVSHEDQQDIPFTVQVFHSLEGFIWSPYDELISGVDTEVGTDDDDEISNGGDTDFGTNDDDDEVGGSNSEDGDEEEDNVMVEDVAALQITNRENITGMGTVCWWNRHVILKADDYDEARTLARAKGAGGGILARKLDPHTPNYNLFGDWLKLCRSTHTHCNKVLTAKDIPGFQVIDCATGEIVHFATITASAEQDRDYITLSYVWGTSSFEGPVTRSNKVNGADGLFLPDQLPLAISDTIQVTKRLGFRYLWIDRYCIPQDDAAAKLIQIQNMGRIYSNSVLTIIAAAGDGPEYGLPGVTFRPRNEQVSVRVTEDIALVMYEPPKNAIEKAKWNTRGWTYQEGLLSRRRLVFTDLMVYFQCQEIHGDEVLSLPLTLPGEEDDSTPRFSFFDKDKSSELGQAFPRQADWTDIHTIWKRIQEFSQRDLGYDADVLNAISGIFEMYAPTPSGSGVAFFCGLPQLPTNRLFRTRAAKGKQRVCSLRELWGKGYQSYDLTSSEEDTLTYRLVRSLHWLHDQESQLDHSRPQPTALDQVRRPMIPSWTWAGWKTYQLTVHAAGDLVLDRCTRIGVQYENMPLLDWERDNEEIHNLSRQGKMPTCLSIRGIVLEMKLTWRTSKNRRGGSWVYTAPSFLKGERLRPWAPRLLLERESVGRRNEIQVLGLIMAYTTSSDGEVLFEEDMPDFRNLILLPVTKMLNGQPHTMFERAHQAYFNLDWDASKWRRLARMVREMDVLLC